MNDKIIRVLLMTAIFLLYLGVIIYVETPSLKDRYTVNGDIRMNHFWMAQFQDKTLFLNDLLADYSKFFQPYGFVFIYFILSQFMDPIWLSKILPLFLFPLTGIFLFRLGRYINGNLAGFLLAVLFLNFRPFIQNFIGGNARAFFLPLLVIFLYYFTKREARKVMVVLVCQSLFYPISFLLSAFVYTLSFLVLKKKENSAFKKLETKPQNKTQFLARVPSKILKTFLNYRLSFDVNKKRIVMFGATMLMCFFMLLPKYIIPRDPVMGGSFTLNQMRTMPEFYQGGRRPILPFTPLLTIIYKRVNDPLISYFLILFLIFLGKRVIKIPRELWYFLIASMLLYKAACIFAYRLYIPQKYIMFSLPLFLFILLAINFPIFLKKMKYQVLKISLVVLFIFLSYHWYGSKIYAGLSQASHNRKNLYRFISSLPKDIILSGHPRDIDEIPLFTQRKVLVTYELSNPHLVGYYNKIKERTFDFFDAYYTDNWRDVIDFCKEYSVDYLIVNRRHFSEEYIIKGEFYFEPFNTYIKEKVKGTRDFVLDKAPLPGIVFKRDDVFVIDIAQLGSQV